jgi:hypothetical protein
VVIVGVGVLLLLGGIAGYGRLVHSQSGQISPPPSPPFSEEVQSLRSQITGAAEAGKWASVADLIDEARKRRDEDEGYAAIEKEYMTALKVECEAHFLRRQGQSSKQPGKLRLAKGDEYWLYLTIPSKCYLYVFEHTGSGRLNLLFPNSRYSSLDNPVDCDARLPENYAKTLPEVYEDEPGTYMIYVLASRWQQKGLEHLISQGVGAAKKEILALLESADEYTPQIFGLAYLRFSFEYAGAAPDVQPSASRRNKKIVS